MARILITGGNGFLGTTVAKKLVDKAEAVIIGDISEPREVVQGIRYEKLDVTKPETITSILERHSIDTIVHLAAIMTPGRDVDFEYRVDVLGAKNVFDAAVMNGVNRIIVSSSGAAYGYHADSPDWITEEDPVRGNDEYSYSKHKRLVEEQLARLRDSNPEIEQVIFRVGTILGPTVANQITKLWDGKRILKISGSESPFVFIWVDDVAEIMTRAALGAKPGIYNVAGDGSLTVSEIAKRINKPTLTLHAGVLKTALAVGRFFKLTEHGPEKVRFLRYRPVLDNTKLKSEFQYTPQKSSAEAFEAYLETHPDVVHN